MELDGVEDNGLRNYGTFCAPLPKPHTRYFDRLTQSVALGRRRARNGHVMTQYPSAVNVVIAVVALVLVIASAATGRSHRVVGAVTDRFAHACAGLGACMFGIAALGCATTKRRMPGLLLAYLTVLLLLAAAFAKLLVTAAVASDRQAVKDAVQSAWGARVADHAADLCDLQRDLRCSGFASDCTGPWANASQQRDGGEHATRYPLPPAYVTGGGTPCSEGGGVLRGSRPKGSRKKGIPLPQYMPRIDQRDGPIKWSCRLWGKKRNHLEERLLDQAQARASYTPLFWGHSRSIPQGMILGVQPLVKSLYCPIRQSTNGFFDSEASIP